MIEKLEKYLEKLTPKPEDQLKLFNEKKEKFHISEEIKKKVEEDLKKKIQGKEEQKQEPKPMPISIHERPEQKPEPNPEENRKPTGFFGRHQKDPYEKRKEKMFKNLNERKELIEEEKIIDQIDAEQSDVNKMTIEEMVKELRLKGNNRYEIRNIKWGNKVKQTITSENKNKIYNDFYISHFDSYKRF